MCTKQAKGEGKSRKRITQMQNGLHNKLEFLNYYTREQWRHAKGKKGTIVLNKIFFQITDRGGGRWQMN